jgi:hypothetical protein
VRTKNNGKTTAFTRSPTEERLSANEDFDTLTDPARRNKNKKRPANVPGEHQDEKSRSGTYEY